MGLGVDASRSNVGLGKDASSSTWGWPWTHPGPSSTCPHVVFYR